MCAACETGFRYRELDNVVSLLDLVCDRVTSGVRSFERPLVELITVCGRPIVREKANEELLSAGLSGFETLLGSLGKMLHVPFPAAQVCAALALQEIAQVLLARADRPTAVAPILPPSPHRLPPSTPLTPPYSPPGQGHAPLERPGHDPGPGRRRRQAGPAAS